MNIVWDVQCHDVLDSTHTYIKTLPLSEGLVVRARSQRAGIGRHGRSWEEGVDNLYFSFNISPDCKLRYAGHLSIITSVALYETLLKYIDHDILQLKWPNDILLNDKKCAGILIDIEDIKGERVENAIIGIGVNIQSAPLDISSCLQNFSNMNICPDVLLDEFLGLFSNLYQDWKCNGIDSSYSKYERYHIQNKGEISVKIGAKIISGLCDGIDSYGNLRLIDDHDGSVEIVTSGEVLNNQG